MSRQYDDIIHLPHPISKKHPQMPIADRAAQFSPFAALTGYEAAIKETARRTSEKPELDENEKAALDWKLAVLQERITQQPQIAVTYFAADERKDGGSCVTTEGSLKKIDDYGRCLVMADGTSLPIEDILEIESRLFDGMI